MIISLLYVYIIEDVINLYSILIIFIYILSAFIGDIIESLFKRINGIKNSSNFLPGHGGFFDRFDSFIFSIFIYALFGQIL